MVYLRLRENGSHPVVRNAPVAEPSTESLGLTGRVDGYYDRAGRRLFLADGSPDPLTPGAYRYRAHPDLCDPTAPETDPASPRYEPPHLRHRPGDTWEIGGKPHDPDDPGPFGTAGWRPDTRTGRHRRAELPDPDPSQDDGTGMTRGPGAATLPEEPDRPLWVVPDRASPESKRRNRFWRDDDDDRGHGEVPRDEEPHRFSKLQEDAWDRFIIKSSELAAAHWANRRALESRHRWLVAAILRFFQWVGFMKGSAALEQPEPVPIPTQPQSARPARTRPGAQLAQAIAGAQTAWAEAACETEESAALRDAEAAPGVATCTAEATPEAVARTAAQQGRSDRASAHWRARPREDRPRPSPMPYIARWERAFDAHRSFGEAVAL